MGLEILFDSQWFLGEVLSPSGEMGKPDLEVASQQTQTWPCPQQSCQEFCLSLAGANDFLHWKGSLWKGLNVETEVFRDSWSLPAALGAQFHAG